jgi:DnaJ family protein C protein 13
MFKLFQHPSLALVKGAGQIMKAMIEEGSAKVAKKIQHGALVVCPTLTASCRALFHVSRIRVTK